MNEECKVNHGILKLFDEILTNAADNVVTSIEQHTPQTFIDIVIGNTIVIKNDGAVPDIANHKTYKQPNPQIIFCNPKAGTNFDDTKKRSVGG